MRERCSRFNFTSMTHSSLSRVIVVVPALLWACAHEVTDYPEGVGSDDLPVGKAGATAAGGSVQQTPEPNGSGSRTNMVYPGGGSSGGKASAAGAAGANGQLGKAGASTGGAAGAGMPSATDGGASMDEGGAAGAAAGSGGGSEAGSGGKAGSAGSPSSGGSGGSASSGGSGNVGACSGVAKWSAGTYAAGARVQNGVNLYQCKPHPYSGWCGLEAYAPGSGWAWTDAWTIVGPC